MQGVFFGLIFLYFGYTSKKPGTVYKPYLHFVLRNCSGKAWVDEVELGEVPAPEKAAK